MLISLTLPRPQRNNQPAAQFPPTGARSKPSKGAFMATAAPPAPPSAQPIRGVQPLRAGEGHSYFWRRLHSLTGIVPIGAFLVEHIISNFEVVNGPLAYAKQVLFL